MSDLEKIQKELQETLDLVSDARRKHTAILNAINTDEQLKEKTAIELADLFRQRDKAEQDVTAALAKLASVQKEILNAQNERDTLRKEISSTSDQLRLARESAHAETLKIESDLCSVRANKDIELQKLNESVATAQNSVRMLQTEITSLESVIEKLLLNKKDVEANIEVHKATLQSLEKAIAIHHNTVADLELHLSELQQGIAAQEALSESLRAKIAEYQQDESLTLDTLNRVKTELDETNKFLTQKKEELQTTQANILAITEKLESLKSKETALRYKYTQAGLKFPED